MYAYRMALTRLLRTLGIVLALAACARASTPAPAASPASATSTPTTVNVARSEAEIRRFEAADRGAPVAPGGVVFVGSSSFRLWPNIAADFPGVPVLNRGFGGSTLPEVNHYVPRIVLPYRPRLVVLYAGDNDLNDGRTPADVLADYRTFVTMVRRELPSARIAFVSIKPSPSRWALMSSMREANRLIREEVSRDNLQTYVDVFTPMLRADGRPRPELFVADSLHMTRAGYDLWRERLAPVVR
jgi:lysophospholipase L1-like esterase